MSSPSFSVSFSTVEKRNRPSRPHPRDRVCATPTPSRVLQLLEDHRPWKMMSNIALIIVNETYAALLEILGPAAPPPYFDDDGGVNVEVSRPVDPADPDSPVLSVNASATHCSIRLVNSSLSTSPGQQKHHGYLLARARVRVSPGKLDVARRAAADGQAAECWKCADDDDVRPNVSEKGLFGVLESIRERLDAAIRVGASLIAMAKKSGCSKSPKINDIIDVRIALQRMRAELDVDAIMKRRRQKRRREVQEISCRTDLDLDADLLATRFRTLHVTNKRCLLDVLD